MTEESDFLQPENLPALPERLGIRMLEPDSIDRVIDGLRMASEGCMHLHYWRDDREDPLWMINARAFDAFRVVLARRARNRPSEQSETRDPGRAELSQFESYERVFDGLKMAAAAARQIATGHRGDLAWTKAANQLDRWRDGMGRLVRTRKRQSAAPSILLPN